MSPADQPSTRPATGRSERIGYVVKVYPRFSETFVVTEILSRENAGDDIAIFAMRPTTDARFHPELAQVQAPVHHLPKAGKLADAWNLLGRAHAEIPDFANRYAAILPLLTRLDAGDAAQALDLALRVRKEGITHLHAHFASLAARVACVASALTGVPYSVTTHAKDIFHEDVDPQVLGEVLRRAHHVITISAFNERHLERQYPEVADHTALVRNGLDLAKFGYRDPGPVGDPLRVVAVGRLVEKKGFAHLVEAAAALTARGFALQVQIAGDGELRDELATHIEHAGLSDLVQLIGPRSQAEIRELLDWADVFAAPCIVGADGNADGLPTVLLEAMATGVPSVATAVTGIPEAIHGADPASGTPATGILLEPGDTQGLAEALRQVAAPDFPRVEIARAARALVERDYDSVRQSRRLSDLQHHADPTIEGAA